MLTNWKTNPYGYWEKILGNFDIFSCFQLYFLLFILDFVKVVEILKENKRT
jgi:hypothetical protein